MSAPKEQRALEALRDAYRAARAEGETPRSLSAAVYVTRPSSES